MGWLSVGVGYRGPEVSMSITKLTWYQYGPSITARAIVRLMFNCWINTRVLRPSQGVPGVFYR